MKVLFAVSNEEISESIVKKYQKQYKEIISYKNVYYFNAILKELQKDKTYDRIVISEELEAFTNTQYDQIDRFIFEKLDSISDEASNNRGNDIPIILICSDRRTKAEALLVKLFGIGIYNALIGNDRSIDEVCNLIRRPRLKKEAKSYYKIDSEEVNYQAENENDVSEMEIQNIVAHYKRLGKNENKYIESFDNIAAQYNDTQLRIISKFLPLNVRAVLEEKSSKYQQIMSFNNTVSDSLRYQGKKEEKTGPSEKLLTPNENSRTISEPIVIPSSVNTEGTKKLARVKQPIKREENIMTNQTQRPINTTNTINRNQEFNDINTTPNIAQEFEDIDTTLNRTQGFNDIDTMQSRNNEFEDINTKSTSNEVDVFEDILQEEQRVNPIESSVEIEEAPVVTPVKRGRGRPRKNPIPEKSANPPVKRGRGRPRKNPIPEDNENQTQNIGETPVLPGIEEKEETFLPGFNDIETNNYSTPTQQKQPEEDEFLPGFDDIETNNYSTPVQQEQSEEDAFLPGFNDVETNNYSTPVQQEQTKEDAFLPGFDDMETNNYSNQQYTPTTSYNENDYYESTIDLSRLLTPDKKIVTFVGTSKNGTSFIVNNIAEYMSSVMGINTAILDTTRNRNSYYIYTKNEEQLRTIATHSIEQLAQGIAQGISANKNLTVYTSLPDENDAIRNVDNILETLLQKHSLILIDTDFDTPIGYFKQSQETYLVQTYDILTIQPLTAFLRELKAKNILDENKLRIILNKVVRIRGINDKTIIGGMAYYNDPSMSFMTELFDRNTIKYVSIPFEEQIYTRYLQGIIECEVSLKGYSKEFMQTLRQLGNMVYSNNNSYNNNSYSPPSIDRNNGTQAFSSNMNNTLEQMRKNY